VSIEIFSSEIGTDCGSTNVEPFVAKILKGTPTTRDYTSLGSYSSALSAAFPWATNVPPKK